MRICLIGCVEFSAHALRTLIELETPDIITFLILKEIR